MINWLEPDKKEYYPLTHPQKRIWFTDQINPETALFNIGGILRIKGEIDPDLLAQSLLLTLQRNDGLRLKIEYVNGEPRQYVRKIDDMTLELQDFSEVDQPEQKAREWIQAKTREPFRDGELYAGFLVKLASDDFIYLHKIHHTISDGWSIALFKEELDLCYTALANDNVENLEERPSYLDFVQDEKDYKASKRCEKHRKFWLDTFQDLPQAVTLSSKISSSKEYLGRRYTIQLDDQTTQMIQDYVQEQSSSIYSFFMALLFTYMYRVTGARDIIIGTPVLNRANARQKNTLGMFVSTMPFRMQMDEKLVFLDFLKAVMSEQRHYYRAQRYPMDLLVKDLDLARQGNPKLFEIALSYQNMRYKQTFYHHPNELEWVYNGFEENSLTIHINDRMEEGELVIDFDYALDAFDAEEIEDLAKHLIQLAQGVIHHPEKPLWQIPYLHQDELEKILYTWNQTDVDYPRDKTVIQLFTKNALHQPEKPALVDHNESLSYGKLNQLANGLGRQLQRLGVKPNKLVGILAQRSLETVMGILAVLKAGAAYLPIDPDYPEERCKYMLEDAQVEVLLIQSSLRERVPDDFQGQILMLDEFYRRGETDVVELESPAGPDDLSYVIYTSGSTGNPKGVMVKNQGLTNYIWWAKDFYIPDGETHFPLYSSLSFDLTVTSIFVPLVKGSTSYIIEEKRGNLIQDVLQESGINIVKLTPAHLALIKDQDNSHSSVEKFILGGEDLKADLARAAVESFQGQLEIYNEYGPTETVVGCIVHQYDPERDQGSVLIGRPIQNTQIYILDQYLQPVPPGAVGEIYISGDGVARGYLNRPELTSERFLENPFVPGKRMYKSGDLARYLRNGEIQYLGRVDDQVKIRGYRIEIGEIEAVLLQHPQIKEVVVDPRKDRGGNTYLAGYFVSSEELTVGDLRSHLLAQVPDYMVPSVFTRLESIPLTSNGKINRRALPEPEGIETGVEYVAPVSEMEKVMVEIWAQVLGVDQVGIHDNFFELGGDSIKAIQVSNRLKNQDIDCKVQDIFTYHTVGQVALHAVWGTKEIRAEQGVLQGAIQNTPILHWFFDQNFAQPEYWNQSILLELHPELDIRLLEVAMQKLLTHHDALRLNYDPENTQLYHQNNYLEADFEFESYSLTGTREAQEEEFIRLAETFKARFDISSTCLLAGAIFELGQKRKLLITAHHLVMDGVSWRILLEDLASIYLQLQLGEEIQLPAKTTSFKEWAQALNEYAHGEQLQNEIPYWREISKEMRELPHRETIAATDSGWEVVNCHGALDRESSKELLSAANEAYRTQTNELLLTALARSLEDWLEEKKFYIWLEGHGREELFDDIDLSRTVGWFTSLFPTRLDLTARDDLERQIKGIKEQIRKIPHRGIGFGILKYLTRVPLKTPDQMGILFNYLGEFDKELGTELFHFSPENTGRDKGEKNKPTALIEINCMVVEDQLEIDIDYSRRHFVPEQIEKLLKNFIENIKQIKEFCCCGENFGFTPADFETVNLSEEDLDQLFS